MKHLADSYFHIGASHLAAGKPCQDYAVNAVAGETAVAIVADGCSTGGQTDVGARIVALGTQRAIVNCLALRLDGDRAVNPQHVSEERRDVMRNVGRILLLPTHDMLSTAVYATLGPDGGTINLQGDGVIAWIDSTGVLHMRRYEWLDNRPAYPVYAADGYASFLAAHGGNADAGRLTWEDVEVFPDGSTAKTTTTVPFREAVHGLCVNFSTDDMPSLVAVFTDGICQVDGIDWVDAVYNCLLFKTTAGEFAKRRMIRFIKDAKAAGKGPLDDIAYAVILAEVGEG